MATTTTNEVPPPPLHPQFPPHQQPVFNGVSPDYPGIRLVHNNPPMIAVDQFLTDHECQFLIQAAQHSWRQSPVVGKGRSGFVDSAVRTSSTCYFAREDVPNLMRKVSRLTGRPMGHCELPQVGRYLPTQKYNPVSFVFDNRYMLAAAATL